jgi:hypothetical protein
MLVPHSPKFGIVFFYFIALAALPLLSKKRPGLGTFYKTLDRRGVSVMKLRHKIAVLICILKDLAGCAITPGAYVIIVVAGLFFAPMYIILQLLQRIYRLGNCYWT